ncbi:hypothetical protein [uncultured Aliiroseovarius sp.]|uniref:hypothetical protein n=1 Tax=uncultured Aliiroseovarius sp. TaxID=1658783 RepID=UPI00261528CE|nr:hypothetical protein [uncultured Aliiroseovarius sp.]
MPRLLILLISLTCIFAQPALAGGVIRFVCYEVKFDGSTLDRILVIDQISSEKMDGETMLEDTTRGPKVLALLRVLNGKIGSSEGMEDQLAELLLRKPLLASVGHVHFAANGYVFTSTGYTDDPAENHRKIRNNTTGYLAFKSSLIDLTTGSFYQGDKYKRVAGFTCLPPYIVDETNRN